MADDDLPSNIFGNEERENNVDPDLPQHIRLDLGDDPSRNSQSHRLGNQNSGLSGSSTSEGLKREENPFSFKHFLRGDSSSSYQNKGARPKVYNENRPPPSSTSSSELNSKISEPKQSRIVPEFSSALPDFVQDHLVIEQCYLGSSSSNNYNLELNNLPDFTRNRDSRAIFEGSASGEPINNSNKPVPLDLPIRPQGSFPLDLPIGNSSTGPRNCSTVSEVGNSKSLPDFLADSAVCSQKSETLSVPHSPESESERLRHELEMTRRQLAEQSRLCESLSRELEIARNKEHEYTQNLAKALEQVEHNLEKSNRRATSAESSVLKLKQEVKSLTIQINNLKRENQNLRGDEAAGGQGYFSPVNELHSHRLAQELRSAASSAEHSLRQLLTGVDNLRIMAATLENMHRIEEKDDRFSNFDEDAGPAL